MFRKQILISDALHMQPLNERESFCTFHIISSFILVNVNFISFGAFPFLLVLVLKTGPLKS